MSALALARMGLAARSTAAATQQSGGFSRAETIC
jgi:hypothetical protein